MGCLFVIVMAGASAAMIFLFGYSLPAVAVLGVLWVSAVACCAIFGHRGFGGGGNMDLNIVIVGMLITAAIIVPRYEAQKPCNQARSSLKKIADAESEYFSAHRTFTADIRLLNLTLKPEVRLRILKADEKSFVAEASHNSCYKDKPGTPEVLTWDSTRGGF